MDVPQLFEAMDRGTLAELVRQALASDAVGVGHWHAHPLKYAFGEPTSRVFGVERSGYGRWRSVVWSLMLKVVRPLVDQAGVLNAAPTPPVTAAIQSGRERYGRVLVLPPTLAGQWPTGRTHRVGPRTRRSADRPDRTPRADDGE